MGTTPSGLSGAGAVVAAITTMLLATMADVVAVAVAVATLAAGAVVVMLLLTVKAEAPGLIRDSGWRVFKLVSSGMAINGAAILCCMRNSMG